MYIVNNAAYIRVYLQTKRRKYQNCFTARMAIKVSALHKIPLLSRTCAAAVRMDTLLRDSIRVNSLGNPDNKLAN